MRRRDFIKVIAGSAAAWPLTARAQQTMRHIGIIMVQHETDAIGQGRLNAFLRGFEQLGWRAGQNVRIDVRWAGGNADRMREIAADSWRRSQM